jgi:PAS domain S-box-containing protein
MMNYPIFDQLVDSLSDALITIDQNKKIVIWNRMAEIMFGYDKTEIETIGIEAIIPPAYRQRHREGYERFMNAVHVHVSYVSEVREFEGLRKSGALFPIELTHSLVKVNDQDFYITAIVRDITLRKRYELMRDRIEHITRHDLKNKLVIVGLAAQRLFKTLGPDEKPQIHKYTEIIQSESKGLIELLDSTKELILLESGEYKRKEETVELADLLNLKAEQIQPVATAKGVNVAFHDRTARRVTLQADRSLLERALENLVKNAVEAEDFSNTVEMILEEGEQGIPVLEIHNGGKPIPEEIQGLIFSPYVTHGKKDGVGLGLYSTKLILETIHGWQISFQSGPQGTTFKVTFGSHSS